MSGQISIWPRRWCSHRGERERAGERAEGAGEQGKGLVMSSNYSDWEDYDYECDSIPFILLKSASFKCSGFNWTKSLTEHNGWGLFFFSEYSLKALRLGLQGKSAGGLNRGQEDRAKSTEKV